MICPYCDSVITEVPNSGVCPRCGGLMSSIVEKRTKLEDYYHRYKPNRRKAIKALCEDTGMGVVEAKKMIDQVFGELSGELHEDISLSWKILKDLFK